MKDNGKQRSFMDQPLFQYFLAPLVVALISIFVTRYLTQRDAVQKLSDGTNGVVSEGDTIEDAASKINDLQEQLQEKQQQIDTLTEQLNDDSEIKKLNEQVSAVQQEKDKLQEDLDKLQKAKDKLQADYDALMDKGYQQYLDEKKLSTHISLSSIESMKNEGVDTDNSGDVSVRGVSFKYYLTTCHEYETYIEYNLDNKYREFKGKAYITKWAYDKFDPDHERIRNASISIQVKYDTDDDYQEIDAVSGLVGDSDPVEIGGDLVGVTRLRIVFKGCGYDGYNNVMCLGDPYLYRVIS